MSRPTPTHVKVVDWSLTVSHGVGYREAPTPPACLGGRAQGCRKAALAFSKLPSDHLGAMRS